LTGIKEAGVSKSATAELFDADEEAARVLVDLVKEIAKKIQNKDE
jgi:hypothetical protein